MPELWCRKADLHLKGLPVPKNSMFVGIFLAVVVLSSQEIALHAVDFELLQEAHGVSRRLYRWLQKGRGVFEESIGW